MLTDDEIEFIKSKYPRHYNLILPIIESFIHKNSKKSVYLANTAILRTKN